MASLIRKIRFKIIIAGDPGVGKTSIIKNLSMNNFEKKYISTVGFQISKKEVKEKEREFSVLIWDIAGQPQFHLIRPNFYQGSSAAIFVFSLTDRPSFYNVKNWVKECFRYINYIPSILVGNKSDLKNERIIITPQGKNLADGLGFRYIETSAKTGENIDQLFELLIKDIFDHNEKKENY